MPRQALRCQGKLEYWGSQKKLLNIIPILETFHTTSIWIILRHPMRGFRFSIRAMNLSLFTFANGGKSPTLLEKDKKIPGNLFFRQKFTFDESPYSPSITLAFPR